MADSTFTRSPREQQLDALIAKYYEAIEQRQPLNRADYLRQHPEFAAELQEYFEDAGRLQAALGQQSANLSATIGTVLLKIRDYQLLSQIGAGGMGTVYLALHQRLQKTVALKILKADPKRDSTSITRFEREMKSVGKLEHPHIVRALDAGDEGGTYFLVMEFLEGCDLGQLLKSKGRLEVPLACELIHQAALGLQHAHDHNLVHRDVKPSNLMLSTTGQVKVLDLGLAQLQMNTAEQDEMTRAGEIVGTWRYMAPEQVLAGRHVDARSDIFSLGVTFYNLLAGELPLRFDQSAIYLPPIVTLRSDVPPDLQLLLGKMLAPNPSDRIQKMSEVAEALQAYEKQGAIFIDALKACLKLPLPQSSNAYDATQSRATMASETEVIAPPFQTSPPPICESSIPPIGLAERDTSYANQQSAETRRGVAFNVNRVNMIAGCTAFILLVALVIFVTNRTLTNNQQRRLAEDRIAELCAEIKQNLGHGDLKSALDHWAELVEVSRKFPELASADTVVKVEAEINDQVAKKRQATNSLFLAAQAALAEKQVTVIVDKLQKYLEEPYATQIDQAQSLLADAKQLIQLETKTAALVASWTDAELVEYLRSGKMPLTITIANLVLRDIYDSKVLQDATRENTRRQLVRQFAPVVEAAAIAARRPAEEAILRLAADIERALRILPGAKQNKEADANKEAAANADWQRHPERHGILGLIPQDAIGGVGVASVNQALMKTKNAVREIRGANQGLLFIEVVEQKVKEVLTTAPFGCYQQDQPLAIVFANPAKSGVVLPVDNINPLFAMWHRPTIESLGVVVGTPIGDLRDVKTKLKMTGPLVSDKILHSNVPYFQEVKQVSILLRDGRLYVGFTDMSVLAVADRLSEQATVAMDMSPREATRMTKMDFLMHLATGAWRKEWKAIAEQIRSRLATDEQDHEAVELANEFAAIMRRANTFLLGVGLDQGVHVSLLALLSRHEDARLEHFQDLIGRGDEPLTLAGLPQDGTLGAFATRGNGLSNVVIAQCLLLLLKEPIFDRGLQVPADKHISLSKAFREVWNQVAGTRAAVYRDAALVVVLDTHDPEKFTERLQELVGVWDKVSVQQNNRYRFTITEEVFDGRMAHRLSLLIDGGIDEQLLMVPIGKQMVVSLGRDNAPLQQTIKNLVEEIPRPGLAEHPAILSAGQCLPATRKMELYLCISNIINLMNRQPDGVAAADAEYSSASLTLGKTSIGLDLWVPLSEILKFIRRF